MKIKIIFILAVSVFLCAVSYARIGVGEVTLVSGETKRFKVQDPRRVVISNPEVVDVLAVTAGEIVLTARAAGSTDFIFWDKSGENVFKIMVFPLKIDELNLKVINMLKVLGLDNVYTKPIKEDGRVLLLGRVRSIEDKEKLRNALGQLWNHVTDIINVEEEHLIEIAVEVMELTQDASKELGIRWPSGAALTEPGAVRTVANIPDAIFGFSDWTRNNFTATLSFLVSEGHARVLSRPRVVCQSGKQAELLVGGEVPIFTTVVTTGGATGTGVEYKEYGIRLKIEPYVLEGGRVQLTLSVEVSELGSAEVIGESAAPTAKAYPLSKRSISTQLQIRDGQILTIGGLIKQKTEEDLKKFPWLADIPILGAFFRHRSVDTGGGSGQRGDVELFIALTPTIIYPEKSLSLLDEPSVIAVPKAPFPVRTDIPYVLQDYVLEVQKQILGSISYPSALLGTGWDGHLVLALTITQVGEVKNVRVVKSSGYKNFDEDALRVVNTIKYPVFPANIRQEELEIEVPIVYKSR